MQTVSEVLGSEGAGIPVISLGETWTVKLVNQAVKSEFEFWMMAEALYAIQHAKKLGMDELYQDLMKGYRTDSGAGLFRWKGEVFRKSLDDIPGMCHLGFLLMHDKHPDLTEDKVCDIYQGNPQGFGDALRESIQGGLPNSKAPVTNSQPGQTGGKSTL